MTSNIQFVSETAASIPVASAPGKVRLFRDIADGLLKFKDNLGAVFPIAGTQDYKDAVRYASTAVLPAYTRLGNTITANAFGALPAQDGVTPQPNDSFLYLNGTGATEKDNGIYTVTQVGSGILPFILDRRGDFADSAQISPGMVVPTGPEGSQNGKKIFILVSPPPIVLNTTAITFEAIGGGGGGALVLVDSTQTIPEKTGSLYSEDVEVVTNGDVQISGDLQPVWSVDNFSILKVPIHSERIVQENDELLATEDMEVDGTLTVDGLVVDVTPITPPEISDVVGYGDVSVHGETRTTTATPALIAVWNLTTPNRVVGMRITVLGRDHVLNLNAHYVFEVTVSRDMFGVVLILEDLVIKQYEDNPAWDVQFAVAGSTVEIRVVGAAGQAVRWRLFGSVSEHG
jgi:hypothetical protein